MDRVLAAREYAGHLTDTDLRLLTPAGPGAPGDGAWLRGDPAALLRLLEDPGTFGTVLGEGPGGWAVQASPFLIFALLVQRAMTELASAAHVPERTGLPGPQRERLAAGPAIDLLEHLGARWYRIACELAPVRTARLAVAGDVADRFRQARRVLNHLADRYLLAAGQSWFGAPGS